MQTVILPGYSSHNREWADLTANKIVVEGIVRAIFWDHWTDPDQLFYPKEKAALIYRHAKGDKLNIVAKSIGTLVAAYIIGDVPDQVNKVILCGIPLHDISDEEKNTILENLNKLKTTQIVCFQNESDPHGSFKEVREFLPESIKVESKPSSDHEYPYFFDFNSFLKI